MKIGVKSYLKISTIHGIRYISARSNIFEKVFWALVLTLSVLLTSKIFYDLVLKMENVPIVSFLSDKSVSVSEIYFPAVTICPHLLPYIPNYKRKGFDQYFHYRYEKNTHMRVFYENDEYLSQTIDERKLNATYIEILKKIARQEINPSTLGLNILKRLQVVDLIKNLNTFQSINFSIPTDDIVDVMNEFEKEFNPSSSVSFFWINDDYQLVSEIITPYGLCFTFNIALVDDFIDVNSTSDDFHFKPFLYYAEAYKEFQQQYLPRQISTSIAGLYVNIYLNYEDFKAIEIDFDGLLIMFHDSFELPTASEFKFLAKSFRLSEITIHPQLFTIDESLISYNSKDRNCYLETERTLKFFKKYTKTNCIQECLTDFMINQCGCVEFFMIRNSTTRICSANEKKCTENAKNDFESQQSSCGCLQSCNYVKYEFENSLQSHGPIYLPNDIFRLDLKVSFHKSTFNNLVQKQQFNELDFLSYLGGLLGLFAGFSVLSFIEIVYWFSIRIVFDKIKLSSTKIYPFNENRAQESILTKIMKHIVSYMKESSIHGIGLIPGSNYFQGFLWIIFLSISMTACTILIFEAREKIPDSRVVAFDDNFKFIGNISFPAFTFIPEFIQGPDVNLKVFFIKSKPTEKPRETPSDDFFRNESMAAFCDPRYDVHVEGIQYDLRPYFPGMMKATSQIRWFQEQIFTFNEKFQPNFVEIMTERGMGFSFNLMNAEELLDFKNINTIFKYSKNHQNSTEIHEMLKFNNKNRAELKLVLKNQHTINDIVCLAPSFLVHNIDEVPTFIERDEFFPILFGMDIDIEVTPEIIRTDQELKSIDSKSRECYFDGEKKLKFFKKYSIKNCLVECFANFTLGRCNCSDNNQPYKEPNFCPLVEELYELHCPLEAFKDYISLDIPSSPNCSCLPTCDSVTYHIKYFHKFSTQSDEILINLRVNTEDAILFRRYQQFTFSDVVSYVGGLLGLFAGISMLSIVEIFYFFVIRVAVDIWRVMRMRRGD